MKQPNDYHMLAESYSRIYKPVQEANATPQAQQGQLPQQQAYRIKDVAAFNSNLAAIDQMEDKIVEFFNTAKTTGWLQDQEINAIKPVMQNFITNTVSSLMSQTDIKDDKQAQDMIKNVQSKIKFVDINQVVARFNALKGAGGTTPGAAGGTQPAAPQQSQNLGYQPGTSYRWQQALDTIKNFQPAMQQPR